MIKNTLNMKRKINRNGCTKRSAQKLRLKKFPNNRGIDEYKGSSSSKYKSNSQLVCTHLTDVQR